MNLICGLISSDPDLMARAIRLLSEHCGSTDDVSETWPFTSTDYYEVEMGEGLQRQFVSFGHLVNPEELPHFKILSNGLEGRICYECGLPESQRRVNLDPGYISLSKLVLATTKDYSHRLYLGEGIYGEVTLHYEHGEWRAWPWTYPDYAAPTYHPFFKRVRDKYKQKLSDLSAASSYSGEREW